MTRFAVQCADRVQLLAFMFINIMEEVKVDMGNAASHHACNLSVKKRHQLCIA